MKIRVTQKEIAELIKRAPLNYPLNFNYGDAKLLTDSNSWELLELYKIRSEVPEIKG